MGQGQLGAALQHIRQPRRRQAEGVADRQLLERFAARQEEDAFEALVRRHGPMVLGVCRRVLQDAHAAEDAFQATFLVLAGKPAPAAGRTRSAAGSTPWPIASPARPEPGHCGGKLRKGRPAPCLPRTRPAMGARSSPGRTTGPAAAIHWTWPRQSAGAGRGERSACPRSIARPWCSATWRARPTNRRPRNRAARWDRCRGT